MLLEVENQRLQEDLQESRKEVQKNTKELQVLQTRLKDAVTWDEHCGIAGKLRRCLYNLHVLLKKDELISSTANVLFWWKKKKLQTEQFILATFLLYGCYILAIRLLHSCYTFVTFLLYVCYILAIWLLGKAGESFEGCTFQCTRKGRWEEMNKYLCYGFVTACGI